MHVQCPECNHVLQIDVETAGQNVRCPECAADVPVPHSTAVTASSRPRPAPRGDDDDDQDERPSTTRPPERSNAWIVVLLFAIIGLPFLLFVSCIGLSALATLTTRDEREDVIMPAPVAMPPRAVAADAANEVQPENNGGVPPLPVKGMPPAPKP
jgi:hypothetical protein